MNGMRGQALQMRHRDCHAFTAEAVERPYEQEPGVHSYALLPIGYPMGRFGPVRRIALADVVYEDRWGEPYRDP
jgi:hypothetical protein